MAWWPASRVSRSVCTSRTRWIGLARAVTCRQASTPSLNSAGSGIPEPAAQSSTPPALAKMAAASSPATSLERGGGLIDVAPLGQADQERPRLRQDFRRHVRFFEHQLDLVEAAAHAQRVGQLPIGRIGVRFLVDQHLDHRGPNQRGHPHAHRVGVPAIGRRCQCPQEILAQRAPAGVLLGCQGDANSVQERAVRVHLAALVVQLQLAHLGREGRGPRQHVGDGLLIVGDAHRDPVELRIKHGPERRQLTAQDISGRLARNDRQRSARAPEDDPAGPQPLAQPIEHPVAQLGQVVGLAIVGQLARLFRLAVIALPVADHLLHRQVALQVIVEAPDPAAEEEEGVLLDPAAGCDSPDRPGLCPSSVPAA